RGGLLGAGGEAHRADELDRPWLAAQRLGDADARLAQRQVERRRLEGPAAVAARDVALRLGREGVDLADEVAELAQRGVAGQVERRAGVLQGDVVDGVVGDVLAEPVLAGAPEVDDGREAFEAGGLVFEGLELVALDLQGEIRQQVEGRHGRSLGGGRGVASSLPTTAFGGGIWCRFATGITLPGPLREASSRRLPALPLGRVPDSI